MKEYQIGEQIRAGEIIGFMGDTGYSEIEGTTGNFDVHLHFGIYLNDEKRKRICHQSLSGFTEIRKQKKNTYILGVL